MSDVDPASCGEVTCLTGATGGLAESRARELSRTFKALGDPIRLRLLTLIAAVGDGEACVCDLSVAFDVSGPTISHHLKVLKQVGLIVGQRRGTWVYYRLAPGAAERLAGPLVPALDPTSAVDIA